MALPFLACMIATAACYHLPPRVLPSILAVEGGHVGSISRHRNGTFDLGVMQGYTLWVPCFADITGMSHDAVRARLVADACFTCVYLNQAKGDVTRAVGLHHSHTPPARPRIRRKSCAQARTSR